MENKENFEELFMVGVPTLALLPAKNFNFTVSKAKHMIELPKKGKYEDYFPNLTGDFCLYEKNHINLPEISKVLFATHKYPKLEDNQIFCPTDFVFRKDTFVIYGQIVTMLEDN